MLLGTFWNNQDRPLYIVVYLHVSRHILCFRGATSALKSLGSDTVPVRSRSAAPKSLNRIFGSGSFLFRRAALKEGFIKAAAARRTEDWTAGRGGYRATEDAETGAVRSNTDV